MKIKLLITLLILLAINPANSYAAGSCLIKNKTAPVLTDYVKNNRQIIKNITDSIIKEKNRQDSESIKEEKNAKNKLDKELLKVKNEFKEAGQKLENTGNEISSIFNEMFNFTGYHSYFKYYVTFPISNDVPFQVKRDYSIIDKENKGMLEYLKKIDQKGETDIIVISPCKGVTKVTQKCNEEFANKETKEIIGKLIQNNDLILDIYRSAIIGEENDIDSDKLILINENGLLDIRKFYSKENVAACNEEKGGFFEQISKAIDNIKLINKKGEDGIKKWKDAYALLLGNKPDEENKIEQKKLKEYLSDKGVPANKQEIMLSNLEKYNQEGLSENNNFLSNTFSSTMKKIKKDLELWKKQNISDSLPKETEKINTDYLKKTTNKAEISRKIEEDISILYQNEIPFAAVGDIKTENLRSKIINSHLSVQDSINTLENTIVNSQKVCKAQGGGGKCK